MVHKREIVSGPTAFQLLTAQQVAEMTGIAVSTLHLYASRREAGVTPFLGPPHTRLGPRKRRWLCADVVAWIESCRVIDRPVRDGNRTDES